MTEQTPNQPIAGASSAEVSPLPDETLGAGGVPANGTPATPPTDAAPGSAPTSSAPATPPARSETDWQRDLNQMKSTFQRQQAQAERQWREREAQYQRQLDEARLAGLDETQRDQYVRQRERQELENLRQQNLQFQAYVEDVALANEWANYFVQEYGIDRTKFDFSRGSAGVSESGWAAVKERFGELRQQGNSQPATPARQPLPAPSVVTQQSGAPQASTWAALRAKYNVDDEGLYRMVEQGLLPHDIIPTGPQ